jgi:threonine/homoserine efflux transporter RhtA
MAGQLRPGGWRVTAGRSVAIVVAMSTSMRRRPLRTVVLAVLGIGILLAVRAAVADKGGSYDPAANLS